MFYWIGIKNENYDKKLFITHSKENAFRTAKKLLKLVDKSNIVYIGKWYKTGTEIIKSYKKGDE